MKLLPSQLFLSGILVAVSFAQSGAQESTEDLVKKLKGQAGKTVDAPKFQTRGIVTRGTTAPPAKVNVETRSVLFSTRGIPKAVQVAAEEDHVKMEKTTATKSSGAGDFSVAPGEAAYEVKYSVDPESKVSRDNILFKKGSAEFADEASFQVVSQLAEALRDPSLAKLNYVIEGHASAEGSAYANQTLSQKRSERIISVMAQLGVNPHRLLPIGFGETQARFPAHSEEFLLKQDRRVLIFRLDD